MEAEGETIAQRHKSRQKYSRAAEEKRISKDNRSSGLEIGPFRSLLICSRAHSIQSLSFCVFGIVLSIFKAPETHTHTQKKCQEIITKAEETSEKRRKYGGAAERSSSPGVFHPLPEI